MELKELMDMPIVFTSEENYNKISIDWIKEYAKKHNFKFDDVMSALHLDESKYKDKSIYTMKNELDILNKISISFIQRTLRIGFVEACDLMDKLNSKKIVDIRENGYTILQRKKLKKYLNVK